MNTAKFRLPDPASGQLHEPGELARITVTDWVKGQPCMQSQPDPMAAEKPVAAKSQKP